MSVLLWGQNSETLAGNIKESLRGAHGHNHLTAELLENLLHNDAAGRG